MVKLVERKEIGNNSVQLSFEKPKGFKHQKGQYAILNLMEPRVAELDLPYRWLPVVSSPKEDKIGFNIELDGSSLSKSCELIDIGDEAIVFGPMG